MTQCLRQIGPDIRDVRDGIEPTDSVTAFPMVESHDTEKRKRLAVNPGKYLAPLVDPGPGRRLKTPAQLWPKAGELLVAEPLRLNTARIAELFSRTSVLSNVWWPIKTESRVHEKALALWINSSLGLVTLLATRNTTQGSWVKFKKADPKELPVLDVRQPSPRQRRSLSRLFDEMTNADFQRLSAMHHCLARRQLDESLATILNLPTLTTLRHLLATEPTISTQPL